MTNKYYILAGDIGTTSIKVALYDDNLQMIADSSYFLKIHYHHDISGSSVQNPEEWIKGFIKCVDDLYKKVPHLFADICVLSLTGQMEDLIVIDKEGTLLYDALLYSDSRAKEETEIILNHFGIKSLFEITGNEFNVLNSCAKILWIKRKWPDIFSNVSQFIFGSKDFINYRLTGKNFIDYTTASTTGLFNIEEKQWDSELIDFLDIQDKSLPRIDDAGRIIGEIESKWISTLHLKKMIPVLNGMGDAAAATLGAGIYKEGEAYIYGGTTGWVALVDREKKEIPVYNLLNHDGLNYINVSPILNAGNAIDWGIKNFYLKRSSDNIDYQKIDELIAQNTSVTNLIFLPYLSGERSPFHDEDARGVLLGLTLNTKSEDILKTIFEGIAFSLYHNIITLVIKNTKPIQVTGGIFQFRAFCQILAHITGRTVETLKKECSNPIFGTAILTRQYQSEVSHRGIAHYKRVEKRYYPEKSETEHYLSLYKIYRALYPKLKEEFRKLKNIQSHFN